MKTYLATGKSAVVTLLTAYLGMAGNATGQTSAPPPPPHIQTAPQSGASVQFYEQLKPHGVWMETEPFGAVWQPRIVSENPAWRPYNDGGKWVWLNNAWCWQSEYEWGSTPFHYGRWMQSTRLGWVWVPGSEWSAGWVTWRRTDTHYHWAPLPAEKSVYVGIGGRSSGLDWGFQFSLEDRHYVSAPCGHFVETVQVNSGRTSRDTQVIYSSYQPAIVEGPGEVRIAVVSRPDPYVVVPVCRTWPVYRPTYCPPQYSHNHYEPRGHNESRHHDNSSQPQRSYATPKPAPARTTASQPAPTDRRTSRIMDIMSRSRK